MGYTQRLVIGVIITIYAYSVFQDANMRVQFHQIVTKISEYAKIDSCYVCSEQVRNVIAAFIFASGVSLVFDISIYMGILSELFFVGLSFFNLNSCFCYGKVQTAFIHLLILFILIANAKAQTSTQTQNEAGKCGDKGCQENHNRSHKMQSQNQKFVNQAPKTTKQQVSSQKKQGKKK